MITNNTINFSQAILEDPNRCMNWCRAEVEELIWAQNYYGFELITLSIILIIIWSIPIDNELFQEHKHLLIRFTGFLLLGYLIMRILQ